MSSSKFYIPTTLTSKGVVVDTSSSSSKNNLIYSSASSKFIATQKTVPIAVVRMWTSSTGAAPTFVVSTTGTVGTISGAGTNASPWTATITGMTTTAGLAVGSIITATSGTGTLYGGSPTFYIVSVINSSTSVTYQVVGGTTPTAGTITNISTTDYIICVGQTLNTFAFRFLHAVIGNKYGGTAYSAGTTNVAGATTTFTLPNFSNGNFPIGSTTSTPTSSNIGNTSFTETHTHTAVASYTQGSANTDHSHNSSNAQDAPHTHNFSSGTTNTGGHSHAYFDSNITHNHLYGAGPTVSNSNTGGISANHTHGSISAPSANHSHGVAANETTHTHTGVSGGNSHSGTVVHNFSKGMSTLSVSHTHSATITGIYFMIRYI